MSIFVLKTFTVSGYYQSNEAYRLKNTDYFLKNTDYFLEFQRCVCYKVN